MTELHYMKEVKKEDGTTVYEVFSPGNKFGLKIKERAVAQKMVDDGNARVAADAAGIEPVKYMDDWAFVGKPEVKETPETVLLAGHSKIGELVKYNGTWYVAVESYSTTLDEGESFVSGGWETVARKATDTEIAAHSTTTTAVLSVKAPQDRRTEFLAKHGVPVGRNPEDYLTDRNLRRLREIE